MLLKVIWFEYKLSFNDCGLIKVWKLVDCPILLSGNGNFTHTYTWSKIEETGWQNPLFLFEGHLNANKYVKPGAPEMPIPWEGTLFPNVVFFLLHKQLWPCMVENHLPCIFSWRALYSPCVPSCRQKWVRSPINCIHFLLRTYITFTFY